MVISYTIVLNWLYYVTDQSNLIFLSYPINKLLIQKHTKNKFENKVLKTRSFGF